MYTVGSLCSGIGGIDLAFALAGFDVRWQVEIDPFCQKILKKHAPEFWPNAKVYSDVKQCGRHNLEPVNALVGGIPCQPASHAGRRKGTADNRWLWPEALRIVREIQPEVCLFENVSGLRTLDNGDSYRQILGELAQAGFDVEWFHLRASDVGAPHRRERIFIVAYAQHEGRLSGQSRSGGGLAGDWPQWISQEDNGGRGELVGGLGTGSDDGVAHAQRSQRRPPHSSQSGMVGQGSISTQRQEIAGGPRSSGQGVAHTNSERTRLEESGTGGQGRESTDARQSEILRQGDGTTLAEGAGAGDPAGRESDAGELAYPQSERTESAQQSGQRGSTVQRSEELAHPESVGGGTRGTERQSQRRQSEPDSNGELAHTEDRRDPDQPISPDQETLGSAQPGTGSGVVGGHPAQGVSVGSRDELDSEGHVAHSDGAGRQAEWDQSPIRQGTVSVIGSGGKLVDSNSQGLQGSGIAAPAGAAIFGESAAPDRDGSSNTGSPAARGRMGDGQGGPGSAGTSGSTRSAQRRLGGVFNALPDRLDLARRNARWPARPGEQQYDWEPPRTVSVRHQRNRTSRLKALGNAVVWIVAAPIAEALYSYLEETNYEGGTQPSSWEGETPQNTTTGISTEGQHHDEH